jgi:hypothetical protein
MIYAVEYTEIKTKFNLIIDKFKIKSRKPTFIYKNVNLTSFALVKDSL